MAAWRRIFYLWTVGWSFLTLLTERLWASFWPLASVLFVFLSICLTGVIFMFGKWGHIGLLAFFALAALVAARRLGARFRRPRLSDIERRIEQQSGLQHRPLDMLHDRPAENTSPEAVALWERQKAENEKLWTRLKIWRPKPDTARQDPYGLRHAALLLMLIGFVFAQQDAGLRLRNAFTPPAPFTLPKTIVAMDIWIEPPAYTGVAPVFLATAQLGRTTADIATVPTGSLLKLRIGGLKTAPKMTYGTQPFAFTEAAPKSYTLEMPLTADGTLALTHGWFTKLGSWPLTITPDAQPVISLLSADPAERAALKITYSAKDDYAITRIYGTITPSPDIPAEDWHETITFDVAYNNGSQKESETHTENLSAHPMAGTAVSLTLTAEDEAGNIAISNIEKFALPERIFKNPTALRLNAERKRLIRFNDPISRRLTSETLADIANRPAYYNEDMAVFMGLVMAVKRLGYDGDVESVRSVQKLLWDLAIRLEDGGLSFVKQELMDALQRLQQALNDKNMTEEQIQELAQDVARKMNEYSRALANEMQQRREQGKEDKQIPPDIAQKLMEHMDMEELMEQMRRMQEGDSREQMQAMTEYLQKMIENIDPQKMEEMQEKEMQTMENLQKLQDLIHDQQKLLDQTNKMEQKQESGEQAGEQGRIRKELGDVMRTLGENMPELPETLGEADQEMKNAQGALDKDSPQESAPHQKQALDKLQEGLDDSLKQIAEQMKRIMLSFGMGGSKPEGYGEGYDPLGRENGRKNDEDVKIPDEKERRRVQEIIRELRGRSNDWERPKTERDYIDRLLDTFN